VIKTSIFLQIASNTYVQDVDVSVSGVAPLSNRWTHIFLSSVRKRVKIETFITKRTLAATLVEILAILSTVIETTNC